MLNNSKYFKKMEPWRDAFTSNSQTRTPAVFNRLTDCYDTDTLVQRNSNITQEVKLSNNNNNNKNLKKLAKVFAMLSVC